MYRSALKHLFITVLFFACLWLPLVKLLLSSPVSVSEQEKRVLAPLPVLSAHLASLRQFPAEFEKYFNDHFGFRSHLIRWHHRLRVQVLNISGSSRVMVGAQGWLFQNGGPHLQDMRNAWPFSQRELEHWAKVLSEKQQVLAQHNIRYLFVIAPSKHTIYPEYLPPLVQRVGTTSRADQLVAYLAAHTEVEVLDLRPALLAAKKTLPTHHQTDTHWNSWGAYVGYREIMARLSTWFPQTPVIPLTAKDFTYRREPGGDLAMALNMGDVLSENSVVLTQPLARRFRYLSLSGEPTPEILDDSAFATTTTTATDSLGPRVLMFRDSFFLAMLDYLSETFPYIYYVPKSPVAREYLWELIREQRPDVVIEERASRWLRSPEG